MEKIINMPTRKQLLKIQNQKMVKLMLHCSDWSEAQLDLCNEGLRKILIDNKIIAFDSFPPPPKDPPGGTNP